MSKSINYKFRPIRPRARRALLFFVLFCLFIYLHVLFCFIFASWLIISSQLAVRWRWILRAVVSDDNIFLTEPDTMGMHGLQVFYRAAKLVQLFRKLKNKQTRRTDWPIAKCKDECGSKLHSLFAFCWTIEKGRWSTNFSSMRTEK